MQDPDQHHRHRLGEVQRAGRGRHDLGHVPQVLVEVGGGALGAGGQQGTGMGENDRVVVHVHDPAVGRHVLRHLVGVVGGGDAGADVKELPNAGLAGQVPHGPGQERPVSPHALHHVRVFPHGGLGGGPVRGEVVLAAEPVIVDAGNVGDAGVDLRQRFPRGGRRGLQPIVGH